MLSHPHTKRRNSRSVGKAAMWSVVTAARSWVQAGRGLACAGAATESSCHIRMPRSVVLTA